MEDMDYYEWEESQKRFTFSKIIKFIFKFICTLIIVGTFALLLGRMTLMKIPKAYTAVTLTDGITQTLENGTFDAVMQEPVEPFNDNGKDENGVYQRGWYHISNVAVSKAAGEVQLTVRYNSRSTVSTLMEKYSLTEPPSGELFVYVLSDNEGNVYTDYVFAAKKRPLYEFRRVIFTGIDLSEAKALDLDVYWIDDVSKDGLMNANFTIYDTTFESETADEEMLKGKNLTFNKAPEYISNLD